VFLSWKLKPTQQRTIGNLNQRNLFGTAPVDHARRAKRLRLDYSIPSPEFVQSGHYIPTDKSVENDGPLYETASTGRSCDGEGRLDLGPAQGRYRIIAVPLWTDDQDLGPAGENAVGAIIEPLDIKSAKGNSAQSGPNLFK
jgi:hypothetical protein